MTREYVSDSQPAIVTSEDINPEELLFSFRKKFSAEDIAPPISAYINNFNPTAHAGTPREQKRPLREEDLDILLRPSGNVDRDFLHGCIITLLQNPNRDVLQSLICMEALGRLNPDRVNIYNHDVNTWIARKGISTETLPTTADIKFGVAAAIQNLTTSKQN